MLASIRNLAATALAAVLLGPAALPAAAGEPTPLVPQADVAAQVPSFAPLVRRVAPAVVNIASTLKKGSEVKAVVAGHVASVRAKEALGSGFIVDPAGYVVTNNHVIENAAEIAVVLSNGEEHPARLIGVDARTDLALLKIDVGHPLPTVSFGDSDAASIGDWVVAVGNPFGLGGTVTAGIISGHERDLNRGPFDDYLQIDAPLNRGNSGGPLFNMQGQVIGINTAIASPNGGSVGIGFAVPAAIAAPAVAELKASGKVTRGWLGVELDKVTPEIAAALGPARPHGVMIAAVVADAPAAKAGLKQGDVVLRFDGKQVEGMHDLPLLIAAARVGQAVDILVWRDGHEVTLKATIARLDGDTAAADDKAGAGFGRIEAYGLSLAALTDATRKEFNLGTGVSGVVVAAERDGAPDGLVPGDVIEQIDGSSAIAPGAVKEELDRVSKSGRKAVMLLLNRHGSELVIGFRLAAG